MFEVYPKVSGPEHRSDGLFEIAIKATVKRAKVAERLKQVWVTSGTVSGKDDKD
jgi:hypothetical protein